MLAKLFIFLQYLLPHHVLSKFAGVLARSKHPIIKNGLIRCFQKSFSIQLDEYLIQDITQFDSFNDFFTRQIDLKRRPIIAPKTSLSSPCDGTISQIGKISNEQIFQAKGKSFSLPALLGCDDQKASAFSNGSFATIYLSPSDYHRVHMPTDGTLTGYTFIPGELFSVNPTTAAHVDQLFARNERIVCWFETARGPMVVILVGAMIVGSMQMCWQDTPFKHENVLLDQCYDKNEQIRLKQGAELGRFLLGSTVITLFPATLPLSSEFTSEDKIKLGQPLFKLGS